MSVPPRQPAAEAPWYRIDLSADAYAGGEADVLESAFRQIYIASNGPEGMAMLGERRDDGYSVFFTPASRAYARALIQAYAAVPVARPTGGRFELRVGDAALALGFARAF